jgi:hypothetical protein
MPDGFMWDMADFVPLLLDTQLTCRGGWKYVSTAALAADINGGIQAPYKTGERLLVVTTTGQIAQVNLDGTVTNIGTITGGVVQNPLMLADKVVFLSGTGAAPVQVTATASAATASALPGSPPAGKYGSVYKSRLMVANFPTHEERVQFSPPLLDPAKTWDVNAWYDSSQPVSAIGALRSVVLIFHPGSVERLRGSKPPDTAASDPGDFVLESLFDACGCGDAKSIAYWNDNCIFADERGVHLTDGAIVRNLIGQGGLLTYWRNLFQARASIAAETYLDYYVVTLRDQTGSGMTLICDLNRRSWFRFTNIRALSYIRSIGTQENLWAGRAGSGKLTSLADCFFPPTTFSPVDDDGSPVLPLLETPWYRLTQEGRKRMRFAYASYDVRTSGATAMEWREQIAEHEQVLHAAAPAVESTLAATAPLAETPMLECGFITNPSDLGYTVIGNLPATTGYTRYRLPIGRHPYGLALRIRQIAASSVTRIYDLGLQAQPDERSRL